MSCAVFFPGIYPVTVCVLKPTQWIFSEEVVSLNPPKKETLHGSLLEVLGNGAL